MDHTRDCAAVSAAQLAEGALDGHIVREIARDMVCCRVAVRLLHIHADHAEIAGEFLHDGGADQATAARHQEQGLSLVSNGHRETSVLRAGRGALRTVSGTRIAPAHPGFP